MEIFSFGMGTETADSRYRELMSYVPSKPPKLPKAFWEWNDKRKKVRAKSRATREANQRREYEAIKPKLAPPKIDKPIVRDSTGGLKRGPVPDPARECVQVCRTVRLTKREAKELARHQKRLSRESTPSTFIRYVLCQWLEAHRERGTQPFAFDPSRLDWRTKKSLSGDGAAAPQGPAPRP